MTATSTASTVTPINARVDKTSKSKPKIKLFKPAVESYGGESAYRLARLSEAVAEYAGSSDDHAYHLAALNTLTRELGKFHGHRVILIYGDATKAKSPKVWLKLDRYGELCVEHAGGPKSVKAATTVAKLTPMSEPTTTDDEKRRPARLPRRGRVDWTGMALAIGMAG